MNFRFRTSFALFNLFICVNSLTLYSYAEESRLIDWLKNPKVISEFDKHTVSRRAMNDVKLLHLGKNSLPERLKMVEESKTSLWINMPYWFADRSGKKLLNAIEKRKKSDEKLDFRLTYDWTAPGQSGDGDRKNIFGKLDSLAGEGLTIWNNWQWFRRWSIDVLSNHLHEKLFITDQKHVIIGGMNHADMYLMGGMDVVGWHDTDTRIDGPAAKDASDYYTKLESLAHYLEKPSSKDPIPQTRSKWIKSLHDFFYKDDSKFSIQVGSSKVQHDFESEINQSVAISSNDDSGCVQCDTPVRLFFEQPFVDRSTKTGKYKSKLFYTLKRIFAHSKHSIRLFVPYLTLTKELRNLIIKTAKRGVKVELLTNSQYSHDVGIIPYVASLHHYEPMIKAGVHIYEWQGHRLLKEIEAKHDCKLASDEWTGNTLHTKAITIDHEVAIVGSHNFNRRSFGLNSEVSAIIENEAFASNLFDVFEFDLDKAKDRKVKCGDQEYPRPSRTKRISLDVLKDLKKKYGISNFFIREFDELM